MEDRVNEIWYQMNMKQISSEEARLRVLALLASLEGLCESRWQEGYDEGYTDGESEYWN